MHQSSLLPDTHGERSPTRVNSDTALFLCHGVCRAPISQEKMWRLSNAPLNTRGRWGHSSTHLWISSPDQRAVLSLPLRESTLAAWELSVSDCFPLAEPRNLLPFSFLFALLLIHPRIELQVPFLNCFRRDFWLRATCSGWREVFACKLRGRNHVQAHLPWLSPTLTYLRCFVRLWVAASSDQPEVN